MLWLPAHSVVRPLHPPLRPLPRHDSIPTHVGLALPLFGLPEYPLWRGHSRLIGVKGGLSLIGYLLRDKPFLQELLVALVGYLH